MSKKTKYHLSQKTGKAVICRATVRNCPVGGKHFDSNEEAVSYLESTMEEKYGVTATPKTSENNDESTENNTANLPTVSPVFKTFGIGKSYPVLDESSGQRWNPDYTVTAKSCTPLERIPEEYFKPIESIEEILVNGEVAGYIFKNQSSGFMGYSTVEQINDEIHKPRTDQESRLDAISELIYHRDNYANKPVVLNTDDDFLGTWRHNPQVINIDDSTSLYVEESKSYGFNSFISRHIFMVKDGKAVSFMKTLEREENGRKTMTRTDVETRNTERRKGYAKELSAHVESQHNIKLRSSGGFTELGFAAFGHNRSEDQQYDSWEPSYNPMNFVYDWDKLQPCFPLR